MVDSKNLAQTGPPHLGNQDWIEGLKDAGKDSKSFQGMLEVVCLALCCIILHMG